MNRYFVFAAGGTTAAYLLGLQWYWGAIAGLVLGILATPTTVNKRVIVENVETGEIKIQPNDAATRRYIQGRGE